MRLLNTDAKSIVAGLDSDSDQFGKRKKLGDDERDDATSTPDSTLEQYSQSSQMYEHAAYHCKPHTMLEEDLSPEPHVTKKRLERCPPYDTAVFNLFRSRDNLWVHTVSRRTAMDMWDMLDERVRPTELRGEA